MLERWQQLLTFALVGAGTAVMYVGLGALFHHALLWPYMLSVALAYVLTVSTHFVLSQRFTFAADKNKTPQQLKRYIAYLMGHFAFSMGSVRFGVEWLGWPLVLASAASIAIATVVGYLVSKHWVFAS